MGATGQLAGAGISDHRGWAVIVTVAIADAGPTVIDRRRVEMLDDGLEAMPYEHMYGQIGESAFERRITGIEASVNAHAARALSTLHDDLAASGHRLAVVSIRHYVEPPDLTTVNARIAADGALYRDALVAAAEALAVEVRFHDAKALAKRDDVPRPSGTPWAQEHRVAAAAAVAALDAHAVTE